MTAETEEDKAKAQRMAAETAETEAMTAAGTHTLSLFKAANGAHVMDDATTPADETAMHVTSVGTAMATIAGATAGAQAAGTTATATWPGGHGGESERRSGDGIGAWHVLVHGDCCRYYRNHLRVAGKHRT